MTTTEATMTKLAASEIADAKALKILQSAGYRPGYVSVGPACIVAEWNTETEARAYAAAMGEHKTCTVEHDSDLGWVTTLELA